MRWLALRLAAIVVIYIVCELVLFTVISLRYGRVFTFSTFAARPHEVTAGDDLPSRGVNFVDPTKVYAGTQTAVYADNCCHVNPEGRRLVVAAIARTVAAALNQPH
jgi:hypothetical protein